MRFVYLFIYFIYLFIILLLGVILISSPVQLLQLLLLCTDGSADKTVQSWTLIPVSLRFFFVLIFVLASTSCADANNELDNFINKPPRVSDIIDVRGDSAL